jgi:hypothetical protein
MPRYYDTDPPGLPENSAKLFNRCTIGEEIDPIPRSDISESGCDPVKIADPLSDLRDPAPCVVNDHHETCLAHINKVDSLSNPTLPDNPYPWDTVIDPRHSGARSVSFEPVQSPNISGNVRPSTIMNAYIPDTILPIAIL